MDLITRDDSEHSVMRDHLNRIDISLEKMDYSIQKMADSVNKFALNVAQSEILHKQAEALNRDIKTEMTALAVRVTAIENSQIRSEERRKPVGWLADKAGTVVVTAVVVSLMGLVLIK
jgi:sulfite reductase beta subunit-like hemoprotein